MQQIMDNMSNCYGCSACANICSQKAIKMLPDEEGFLYPIIDAEKCIDCGKCRQVCPAANSIMKNRVDTECYAVIGEDKIRENSSSGGMFWALATEILKDGGAVCGAIYSDDYFSVVHKLVDKTSDLEAIRGSKYMQSNMGNVYSDIKQQLDADKHVLFSGCPCQVAGLKAFLGSTYEKLITVDLICHGVPTPKAWNEYLNEIIGTRKIAKVNMRNKTYGWSCNVSIKYDDGTEECLREQDSPWMKGFLSDVFMRKSCATCPYASANREGDITIADFWGVDNYIDSFNDQKGTSMVLINTQQGKKLFERTINNFTNYKKKIIEFEKIKFSQGSLYKSNKHHPGRNDFFESLKKGNGYNKSLEKALLKKYDYGILGYWFTNNYGAVLTSYALYKVIEKMGYNPLLIDVPDMIWQGEEYRNPLNVDRRFLHKHCNISRKFSSLSDTKELNRICDSFLVGSDQLWGCTNGFFYLEFAEEYKKKIAYGTGFGSDCLVGNEIEKNVNKYLLKRFDAISVRERNGVQICKNELGIDVEHVIDPVFLCDKENYIQKSECSKNQMMDKEFIVAYILKPTYEKQDLLEYLGNKYDCEIIIIPDMCDHYQKYEGCTDWRLPHLGKIEIEDWLFYIKNAKYIITDSYHGFCFSLIFEKDFVCLEPRSNFERFESLAQMLGVRDKVGLKADKKMVAKELQNKLCYKIVNKKIDLLKKTGREWLEEAINIEKSNNVFSTYDIIGYQADREMLRIREEIHEEIHKEFHKEICRETDEGILKLMREEMLSEINKINQDKYNISLFKLIQESIKRTYNLYMKKI